MPCLDHHHNVQPCLLEPQHPDHWIKQFLCHYTDICTIRWLSLFKRWFNILTNRWGVYIVFAMKYRQPCPTNSKRSLPVSGKFVSARPFTLSAMKTICWFHLCQNTQIKLPNNDMNVFLRHCFQYPFHCFQFQYPVLISLFPIPISCASPELPPGSGLSRSLSLASSWAADLSLLYGSPKQSSPFSNSPTVSAQSQTRVSSQCPLPTKPLSHPPSLLPLPSPKPLLSSLVPSKFLLLLSQFLILVLLLSPNWCWSSSSLDPSPCL